MRPNIMFYYNFSGKFLYKIYYYKEQRLLAMNPSNLRNPFCRANQRSKLTYQVPRLRSLPLKFINQHIF